MASGKTILIVFDGWGIGDGSRSDAIARASTPFFDALREKHPHSTLRTDGENVGLPAGQMGNSEVGHLNIGAGRIVYQDLLKINRAVKDGSFWKNPVLLETFDYVKKEKAALHLIGLLSDGGVHSSREHLHALCDMAKAHKLEEVFVHAFTDGRDCDPHSGEGFVRELQQYIKGSSAALVSVVGRYYAMDRDRRWERIKTAYDLLVRGIGEFSADLEKSVKASYDKGITDEFVKPIVKAVNGGKATGRIKAGDAVICFNFRTDRCRQITMALTRQDFPEHDMRKLPLYYVTMTNYDDGFTNVHAVFPKEHLHKTLGEQLSVLGKKQLRIAETEKYPHVTYFFSGGREEEFEGERRILVPSPKVATYDLQPEMSAREVTEQVVTELKKKEFDFVCLNFANPDMVGHTGDYEAVTKAVETVDACLKMVVETAQQNDYSCLIIADHGNADYMINEDGSPNTAHTRNPVPCVLISSLYKEIRSGILADIAPTVLKMMNVDVPETMTGKPLV